MSDSKEFIRMIHDVRKPLFITMIIITVIRKIRTGYSDVGFLVCMSAFQLFVYCCLWARDHRENDLYMTVLWLFCTCILFILFWLSE